MVSALSEVETGAAVQVLLALMNVVQTLALAVMADRSRRIRRADRRPQMPRQRGL